MKHGFGFKAFGCDADDLRSLMHSHSDLRTLALFLSSLSVKWGQCSFWPG